MLNSNMKVRNKTILKALLLTVLPMIFSGVGGYFFSKVESVKQEALNELEQKLEFKEQEISALKKQDSLFLVSLYTINENWKNYFDHHFNFIEREDTIAIETIKYQIEDSGTNLIEHIDKMEKNYKDSIHVALFQSYKEQFDTYLRDMTQYRKYSETIRVGTQDKNYEENFLDCTQQIDDLREIQTDLKRRLDACIDGGQTDDQRLAYCNERKRDLELQLRETENEVVEARNDKRNTFYTALFNYRGQRLNEENIRGILLLLGYN